MVRKLKSLVFVLLSLFAVIVVEGIALHNILDCASNRPDCENQSVGQGNCKLYPTY